MEAPRRLIDTSILLSHLRDRSGKETRLERSLARSRQCHISAVTEFEVELGARRAGRESDLTDLLDQLDVLPFGSTEARHAAVLQAELLRRNRAIGIRDLFIAATCLVHGLPIETENVEHFQRVPGLVIVPRDGEAKEEA